MDRSVTDGPQTLTAVLNLHRELRLAYPTLRSLARTARAAAPEVAVDVLIVLDRPDAATEEYIREAAPRVLGEIPVEVVVVDNGDLGLSRNDGVQRATGTYVAMCDGDNLLSRSWFRDAVTMLASEPEPVVVHPQYIVSFEASDVLWKVVSSRDPLFDAHALAQHNYWDATCIARRDTFLDVPYVATRPDDGVGPEDWQWNAETLARGIDHLPVPGTSLFYRIKRVGSLLARHVAGGVTLPHSAYFADPAIPARINDRNRGTTAALEVLGPPSAKVKVKAVARRGAVRVAKTGFRTFRRVVGRSPQFPMVEEGLRELAYKVVNASRGTPSEWGETPESLFEEWRAIHELEPDLYPDRHTLGRMQYYDPRPHHFTTAYWDLVGRIGDSPDYIFVVPWLRRGGADKVILNYVRAILEKDPEAGIVVLGTEPGESGWASRLPDEARFVQVPDLYHTLPEDVQDRFIAMVLTQLAPRVIHLVNSNVGYRVFRKNSAALSLRSRLFLSVFCIDETEEGRRTHYALDGVRQYARHISAMLTDNADIVRFFQETYDIPASKFAVHYQPVDEPADGAPARAARPFTAENPLRILWAARFDRQKRLDILARVAEIAAERGLPVEFHAFGSAGIDVDAAIREIQRSPHVVFRGAFDGGIEVLEPESFDALMLTSQWEGLPNTILEAAVYGLPTISPRVGGVAEFVSAATGYLVEDFADAEAYVAQIEAIVANPEELIERGRRADALARSRHGWGHFSRSVAELDVYFRS